MQGSACPCKDLVWSWVFLKWRPINTNKTLQLDVFLRFLCLFRERRDKIYLHLSDTTAEQQSPSSRYCTAGQPCLLQNTACQCCGSCNLPPSSKRPEVTWSPSLISFFWTFIHPLQDGLWPPHFHMVVAWFPNTFLPTLPRPLSPAQETLGSSSYCRMASGIRGDHQPTNPERWGRTEEGIAQQRRKLWYLTFHPK